MNDRWKILKERKEVEYHDYLTNPKKHPDYEFVYNRFLAAVDSNHQDYHAIWRETWESFLNNEKEKKLNELSKSLLILGI